MLLEHPDITDCAVVGLPDEVWGEIVAAVIVSTAPEKVEFDPAYLHYRELGVNPHKLLLSNVLSHCF